MTHLITEAVGGVCARKLRGEGADRMYVVVKTPLGPLITLARAPSYASFLFLRSKICIVC